MPSSLQPDANAVSKDIPPVREKILARIALLEKHSSYPAAVVREIQMLSPAVLALGSKGTVKLILRFGRLLERAGSAKDQSEFLKRARTQISEPALDLALALLLVRNDAILEARRLLEQIPEPRTLDPELCARAARLSRSVGDSARAQRFLERAVLADPSHYIDLLRLYRQNGQTANATRFLQSRMKTLEEVARLDAVQRHELNALREALAEMPPAIATSKMVLRLSRLIRRAAGPGGQHRFLAQLRSRRSDPDFDIAYAAALIDDGAEAEAELVLKDFSALPDLSGELCAKLGRLHRRLQNFDDAKALFEHAANADRSYLPEYIQALVLNGEHSEAADRARHCTAAEESKANLLFACYAALTGAGAADSECDHVRAQMIEAARREGVEAYWAARALRFERKYNEAITVLDNALAADAADSALARERLGAMIASGEWGRYGRALTSAISTVPAGSELGEKLLLVDRFLREFACPPDALARGDLRIPDAIFERVTHRCSKPSERAHPRSLLMVGSSLAPGGAERIFATLARQLSESPEFGAVNLRFSDLDPRRRRNFYLSHVESAKVRIALLDRRCQLESPLNFLPAEHAKTAQAVLQALREQRPDVLYVALEPLTVFSALAAVLAGIPRIIMHSHNMPPTELHPRADFPDRLRECYRGLLNLPNITLVTCAEAAAKAYAQWLGVAPSKVVHVHNGLDFSGLEPADQLARSAAREQLGIGPDEFLVGTAFSFREEKQPLLWLDAAVLIHSAYPNTKFVMFGDGRLWDQARQHAQSKGLGEVVSFPGLVTDLYQRLPALDLFILSSRSEALPNVLIEAQAVGVPVISLPVGGAGETFSIGETGLLADGLDEVDLAAAASRAIQDPQWRSTAAARAPAFVRSKFDLGKMSLAILELLRA